MSQLASEPTTLPASQPVSQLASQPASQSSESVSPVSQSDSQPTDQPTITLVHGSHEQPIEQTTQTVKVKTNQLIIHEKKMMILKVVLNLLKIGYVQVETPKYPRPCTLACNCKIIWDSDFDKVGGQQKKIQNHPRGEASRKITLNFNLNKDFPVN